MGLLSAIAQPTLIVLALLAGITFVYSVEFKSLTTPVGMLVGGLIAFGVYQISVVRRPLMYLFRKTQAIKQKTLNRMTSVLIPVGCVILYLIHVSSGRPFEMMWHDEFQFHLQSQLVARGRLWMPPHPLGEFFDTFYVLITPVYAPQSFPGAAMIYAPTVWFNLPTWLMPLVVASTGAALAWRLLSKLVDPWHAFVGWVVLLSLPGYQRLSTMYLAQIPVMVLCLGAILAALRYQKTRGWGGGWGHGDLHGLGSHNKTAGCGLLGNHPSWLCCTCHTYNAVDTVVARRTGSRCGCQSVSGSPTGFQSGRHRVRATDTI